MEMQKIYVNQDSVPFTIHSFVIKNRRQLYYLHTYSR